jgi:hypothetical protein
MKDYGGQVKANEAYTGGIFVCPGIDVGERGTNPASYAEGDELVFSEKTAILIG